MASQLQYNIFKVAYDEELNRSSDLRNTGKIFLSICSFFLGGLAFKLNDIFSRQQIFTLILFFVSLLSFLLAYILLSFALGIYSHERMFRPRSVVNKFGEHPPKDEDFLDDRIIDITVAWETNCKVNNHRAKLLRIASWAMIAGIILAFSSLVGLVIFN